MGLGHNVMFQTLSYLSDKKIKLKIPNILYSLNLHLVTYIIIKIIVKINDT